MNKLNPKIIRDKFNWLNERDQKMIVHNDIDGILTAMFFKQYLNWEVAGVYDLNKINVSTKESINMKDFKYVDLDVTFADYCSIGHHIIGPEIESHLNVNHIFNVDDKNYNSKFPLSTVLFLYWLYEVDLPNDFLQNVFLLHSDSTYKNYTNYKNNVTNWVETLGMESLLDILNHKDFKMVHETQVLPNTYSYNKQSSYTVNNGIATISESRRDLNDYLKYLCSVFNFNLLQFPTDMTREKPFNRKQIEIQKGEFNSKLENLKTQATIFSYSLKYSNVIDISYF